MVVCDWGTIFEIEPAILPIFDMPVGTDLTLVYEGQKSILYLQIPVKNVYLGANKMYKFERAS